MKTRTKLISTILTPAAILPLAGFVVTSCSHEKTIIETLYDSMIQEFYWVCRTPRPTYHTQRFMYSLIYHIFGIFSDDKDFKGVTIDKGYEPAEPSTDYGTNFYFDIPASSSEYNDYPKIILQCHTDMVWQTAGVDVPDRPIPVMERKNGKWVIHTEGYKTSLGADNGAGIAICLAIAKNYKKFNHGPIRVLMTTDEEDGPSGAVAVPEDWFDDCNFLVNLDLEETMRVCRSTAGVQQMKWTRNFNSIGLGQGYDNGYTILIDGLQGGHSAKAITKKRANSIKIGTYILKKFYQDFPDNNIEICSIREIEEKHDPEKNEESHVCPTTPGSIPKYLKIVFASDYIFPEPPPGQQISGFQLWLNKVVNDWKQETKDLYTEDKLTVMGDVVDNPSQDAHILSSADSKKLIEFIDALPFEWEGEMQEGVPRTSYNIGGLRINDDDYSVPIVPFGGTPQLPVYLEVFARSADSETLGPSPEEQDPDPTKWIGMMGKYYKIGKNYWPDEEKPNWESAGWNPTWVHDNDDKLTDILIEGGRAAHYEPQLLDEHSWLEIGAFAQKKPELDIAAIGPTIDDVHSVRETFYVETAKPMFAMLLYAFEHLKGEEGKYE